MKDLNVLGKSLHSKVDAYAAFHLRHHQTSSTCPAPPFKMWSVKECSKLVCDGLHNCKRCSLPWSRNRVQSKPPSTIEARMNNRFPCTNGGRCLAFAAIRLYTTLASRLKHRGQRHTNTTNAATAAHAATEKRSMTYLSQQMQKLLPAE